MTVINPRAKDCVCLHPTVSKPKSSSQLEGPKRHWLGTHIRLRVFLFFLFLKQKRVITVRECARAQGFPDDYRIESTSTDPRTVLRDVRFAHYA